MLSRRLPYQPAASVIVKVRDHGPIRVNRLRVRNEKRRKVVDTSTVARRKGSPRDCSLSRPIIDQNCDS